jgi:hypothetical protein
MNIRAGKVFYSEYLLALRRQAWAKFMASDGCVLFRMIEMGQARLMIAENSRVPH